MAVEPDIFAPHQRPPGINSPICQLSYNGNTRQRRIGAWPITEHNARHANANNGQHTRNKGRSPKKGNTFVNTHHKHFHTSPNAFNSTVTMKCRNFNRRIVGKVGMGTPRYLTGHQTTAHAVKCPIPSGGVGNFCHSRTTRIVIPSPTTGITPHRVENTK